MSGVTMRGYRGGDEDGLLAVWNSALPLDSIDAATFRRKVLLDPNFDPEWLLIAETGSRVAGFCLCIIRREPLGGQMHPETSWITAMGVCPDLQGQGIGETLLDAAVELFRGAGRQVIHHRKCPLREGIEGACINLF